MLDLKAIEADAAERLRQVSQPRLMANPANRLTGQPPEPAEISRLATLATSSDVQARTVGTPASLSVDPRPRPYRLTPAELDVAHADPWDDAAIARFQARAGRLRRLGFTEQDAEDLAERLHFRDVHADYRHLCLECHHYRPGRCSSPGAADLKSSAVSREWAATFQHCRGFTNAEDHQ